MALRRPCTVVNDATGDHAAPSLQQPLVRASSSSESTIQGSSREESAKEEYIYARKTYGREDSDKVESARKKNAREEYAIEESNNDAYIGTSGERHNESSLPVSVDEDVGSLDVDELASCARSEDSKSVTDSLASTSCLFEDSEDEDSTFVPRHGGSSSFAIPMSPTILSPMEELDVQFLEPFYNSDTTLDPVGPLNEKPQRGIRDIPLHDVEQDLTLEEKEGDEYLELCKMRVERAKPFFGSCLSDLKRLERRVRGTKMFFERRIMHCMALKDSAVQHAKVLSLLRNESAYNKQMAVVVANRRKLLMKRYISRFEVSKTLHSEVLSALSSTNSESSVSRGNNQSRNTGP